MARVLTAVAGAAMAGAALAVGYFSKFLNPVPAVRSFSASQSLHQVADPVWNLSRLNHVAIAVPDLKKSTAFYQNILGAQVSEVVPLPEHGVSVVFVNLGNTKMELLHPLGNDSPIAGFLQKNKAGGMHHICIEFLVDTTSLYVCGAEDRTQAARMPGG
ncbi:methylmalonyl-CoA epimerase, mitochondrial isoform X2 [Ictidomys tridecemlineatus]